MSEYLFVYGTLRPAVAPPEVADAVSQWRFIGPARVRGRLYDLGQYPGAALDEAAASFISGEVFGLPQDSNLLNLLDAYEGFDAADHQASLFIRAQTRAALSDGSQLECWIYVYNRTLAAAPLIASGDYVEWQTAKRDR
jgi:gamma-glutamylcyclotransferase (GGCT)/AIG2-like uncharacterized protein YtfP